MDHEKKVYSPAQLASLAGVSVRTLHLYDEIGLLTAHRRSNGYREYGSDEVLRLQRILQLRATGLKLDQISRVLDDPDNDELDILNRQRGYLVRQVERLTDIIDNIDITLDSIRKGTTMSDEERFAAFNRERIERNEALWGKEARRRYGDEAIDVTNARVLAMDEKGYEHVEGLEQTMAAELSAAMVKNDPSCAESRRAFELHRQWLCSYWAEGTYSSEAHRGLAQMYVLDERFTSYYEALVGPGAAEFLREIIDYFTSTD